MCDPNDPYIVRQVRCKIIVQLILDGFYALLALSTLGDGGYLGLPAAVLGLTGCVTVVGRLAQPTAAYTLLRTCNACALPFSAAHIVIALWRAATVNEWCCEDQETNPRSVAGLLYALCTFFAFTAVARVRIAFGSNGAGAARDADNADPGMRSANVYPASTEIPVGQPVFIVPSSGMQVASGLATEPGRSSARLGQSVTVEAVALPQGAPVVGVQVQNFVRPPVSPPLNAARPIDRAPQPSPSFQPV